MARMTYLFFSLTHLSISAAQSYTSLEDMPAWKTLPPVPSNVVKYATSAYYAGCVISVPQISTAACFATLPAMSSSLLSNIVWPGFWNGVPTQFQASATSVAKEWYGQPAVEAAIGNPTPTQTPTKISSNPTTSSSTTTSSNSAASTDTPTPVRKGFQGLSTTAQVFTILGPIVGAVSIIVAIVLYRKGRLPYQRNPTVSAQSNRLNFHFHQGGGGRRDEIPPEHDPYGHEPSRTSDDVSDGSAISGWTPITRPSRPAIRGPSPRN